MITTRRPPPDAAAQKGQGQMFSYRYQGGVEMVQKEAALKRENMPLGTWRDNPKGGFQGLRYDVARVNLVCVHRHTP